MSHRVLPTGVTGGVAKANAPDRINFVERDLIRDQGWPDAMAGIDVLWLSFKPALTSVDRADAAVV